MPTVWCDLANSRNTWNISNLKEVIWNALICTVHVRITLYGNSRSGRLLAWLHCIVLNHCEIGTYESWNEEETTNRHLKNRSTQSKPRIIHTYAIGNELSCYSQVFPRGRHQTYFSSIRVLFQYREIRNIAGPFCFPRDSMHSWRWPSCSASSEHAPGSWSKSNHR